MPGGRDRLPLKTSGLRPWRDGEAALCARAARWDVSPEPPAVELQRDGASPERGARYAASPVRNTLRPSRMSSSRRNCRSPWSPWVSPGEAGIDRLDTVIVNLSGGAFQGRLLTNGAGNLCGMHNRLRRSAGVPARGRRDRTRYDRPPRDTPRNTRAYPDGPSIRPASCRRWCASLSCPA